MVYRSDSVSMAVSQEKAAAALDEGRYRLVPGADLFFKEWAFRFVK